MCSHAKRLSVSQLTFFSLAAQSTPEAKCSAWQLACAQIHGVSSPHRCLACCTAYSAAQIIPPWAEQLTYRVLLRRERVVQVQEFFGDFAVLDPHHFAVHLPKPAVALQPLGVNYADRYCTGLICWP